MAVKIRLRRMGRNKAPFYRVVATDSRCPADGRFLETLGWYDPMKKGDDDCSLNMERVEYWRQNGAQLTDTVRNLVKRMAKQVQKQPQQAEPAANAEPAQPPVEAQAAETGQAQSETEQ